MRSVTIDLLEGLPSLFGFAMIFPCGMLLLGDRSVIVRSVSNDTWLIWDEKHSCILGGRHFQVATVPCFTGKVLGLLVCTQKQCVAYKSLSKVETCQRAMWLGKSTRSAN